MSTVSIIIPAYNVEGYIEKCLDSIAKQTFHDFEVIVVDDGSTDQTPYICDTFAKQDCRFQIVHKKNEGVSKARNVGIELAKGNYVLFFDGDDFVESTCIEELYNLMEEKQVDIILYGYHRYNEAIFETSFPMFEEGYYAKDKILHTILPRFIGVSYHNVNAWIGNKELALYVENPALWRCILKLELIKSKGIRFKEHLRIGEDTIFMTTYLSYANSCLVHHQCYYYLVTRKSSAISTYEQNAVAKLQEKLKIIQARKVLTEDIKLRRNYNISDAWGGTVVMSCMELAFLFAKPNKTSFFKRYQFYKLFLEDADVKSIVKKFRLKRSFHVKMIPFVLLKCHCYLILFLCSYLLQMMHYEFQRD